MTTLFPTGQLVASSDFLSLIPRSAMIQAIVRHVTDRGRSATESPSAASTSTMASAFTC